MSKTTEVLKLAEEALYNTGNALMCLTTTRKLRPIYQEMRDDATEGCNKALAAIREALDHSGDANEMVMDWSKAKPEAIKSDPMYQMGYAAAKAEPVNTRSSSEYSEPVKQEPVAWGLAEKVRRDLDRQSCPDAYMRIAMESIVKHYPAPVSAEAIRAEALEQAEEIAKTIGGSFSVEFLAAIRGLK